MAALPKENVEAGCQNCHAADACSRQRRRAVEDHQRRQRHFPPARMQRCHRYEGYDREPEDLSAIGQQIKQFEQQKIDNLKQANYLMKQADSAASNEEAKED